MLGGGVPEPVVRPLVRSTKGLALTHSKIPVAASLHTGYKN